MLLKSNNFLLKNLKIKFEFLHLRKLKHPRIIKVKRLFIDPILGKVYTIMELVNAPEMFITI